MNHILNPSVRVLGISLLLSATQCTSPSAECTATSTEECMSTNGSADYYDKCDADVPTAECYATRRAPESEQVDLATDIAVRWMDEHPAEEQSWDWGPGVLMFALTELHRVTGDEELREELRAYYSAWLDHHIQEGYSII